MKKMIDLHTHTTASDGIYSSSKLIDLCIKRGIVALAITDHDTIDGLEEGSRYAEKKGFNLIPGVEFSIEYSGGSFHLVGLYVDIYNQELIDITERLKQLRRDRFYLMVDDIKKNGFDISAEEILSNSDVKSVGKPHIARALLKKGYANDIEDIFKKFMTRGKPGYVRKEKISSQEGINIIKKAGGVSIIAHPITLNFKSFNMFENQIQDLITMGLDGIEVYSTMHSVKDIEDFQRVASKFNLIVTGGSDFHGDKDKELGMYADDKPIPVDLLDKLKKYKVSYLDSKKKY